MKFSIHEYPGLNRFVADWLRSDGAATRFLPRREPGRSLAEQIAAMPRRQGNDVPRQELVDALDRSNRHWGSFVGPELRSWAAGERVAIVAGQQTGFAGGPLYTLAKLASVVRLKRDLEKAGVPAIAFFWLASEDHDYSEAATLAVPVSLIGAAKSGVNRELDLLTLRATRSVDSRAMVGPSRVPEPLIAQLLSLLDMKDRPSWLREGITFTDSFAELCATAMQEKVVFVDALLPELRRAGAPLFERIIAERDALQRVVRQRSIELEAGGYAPQIQPRPGEEFTFLFRIGSNNEREIIDDGAPAGDPATISTSALTRPLLQAAVLAPDVFIGGPAEVAYYAQIAPMHEHLGISMPVVALRGHVLIASSRLHRLFEKYSLTAQDMFSSADAIVAAREPESVREVKQIADEARRELARQLTRIGEIALPADHAVARALNRSIGHIEYHFDKLTQRAVRGLVRKDQDRYAALRELVSAMYPDRHVQDRIVGWFAWWCHYGAHFIDRVIEEVEPDVDSFKVVSL